MPETAPPVTGPKAHHPVLPGAVIGVLGGGQLGRMLGIAAKRMGYRLHVLDPTAGCPASQVADYQSTDRYDNVEAARRFAESAEVLSFEFEHVPAKTLRAIREVREIHPSPEALHTCRHRVREKRFLRDRAGVPVSPFHVCQSAADVAQGLGALGGSCVLKTAEFGYDGKGQVRITDPGEAKKAWDELQTSEAVLEQFVDFDLELSVVLARGRDGQIAAFDPAWNVHENHILDLTTVPAPIEASTATRAVDLAKRIARALDLVGVLAVEMFLIQGGARDEDQLLINELAPRPHNSGHFTFDACVTSQFEQQLRAVCGLDLGEPSMLRPASAMTNLLGDLWFNHDDGRSTPRPPDWAAVAAMGDVKLHVYGKHPPRPGRKMGHLTAMADTPDQARRRVLEARQALSR